MGEILYKPGTKVVLRVSPNEVYLVNDYRKGTPKPYVLRRAGSDRPCELEVAGEMRDCFAVDELKAYNDLGNKSDKEEYFTKKEAVEMQERLLKAMYAIADSMVTVATRQAQKEMQHNDD